MNFCCTTDYVIDAICNLFIVKDKNKYTFRLEVMGCSVP